MDWFVCFQEPFWVALVFVDRPGRTDLYRHVFGPSEPTEPDVLAFARDELGPLLRGRPAGVLPARDRSLPPTRAARLRVARDAVEHPALTAEVAEALEAGRRARRTDARTIRREHREAAAEADRERARDRRREHHRHG